MKGLFVLAMILFFFGLIILGPLVTIWALNTLFHCGIQPGLGTWFATLWLCGIVAARVTVKKS